MSLDQIVNRLTGQHKEFDVLHNHSEIEEILETHAETGIKHYYGETSKRQKNVSWSDIEQAIEDSEISLKKTDAKNKQYYNGIGNLTKTAKGTKLGLKYNLDGQEYNIFYLEPTNNTELVEETDSKKLLHPSYIIGEILELNFPNGTTQPYTWAEHRQPETPLTDELERPLIQNP